MTAQANPSETRTALKTLAARLERLRVGVNPGATLVLEDGARDVEILGVSEDVPADLAAAGVVRWARYDVIDAARTGAVGETAAGDVVHLKRRDGEVLTEEADVQILATDGGVEYTPLQEFAARISGELCLDARALEGQGVAEINASPSALKDNAQRLEDDGYNTELYLDEEPPSLLIHPRPGDLEPETGDEARYVAVDAAELERGDRVIVQDVASDLELEGDVTGTTNEAGRVGVIVKEDDGTESVAWDNTGRTYTRIEE